MSAKYSIDQTSKTLIFTGKLSSLNKKCVKKKDIGLFTSVVIPNSVVSISKEAFCNYPSVASVHIPNSVTIVGYKSFSKCHVLASIHIPNSVSSIHGCAFKACHSLASIHIPNSVFNVGGEAFERCHALASIHIPNSITFVSLQAFDDCLRLHKACVPINSELLATRNYNASFSPQTALLRPRLKPIRLLQKKFACRSSKVTYSISL